MLNAAVPVYVYNSPTSLACDAGCSIRAKDDIAEYDPTPGKY